MMRTPRVGQDDLSLLLRIESLNAFALVVTELRDKIDALTDAYDKINEKTGDRKKDLDNTLGVSEKFWDDLNSLLDAVKDLQETMDNQESPGLEPRVIRDQQDALEVDVLPLNFCCYDSLRISSMLCCLFPGLERGDGESPGSS